MFKPGDEFAFVRRDRNRGLCRSGDIPIVLRGFRGDDDDARVLRAMPTFGRDWLVALAVNCFVSSPVSFAVAFASVADGSSRTTTAFFITFGERKEVPGDDEGFALFRFKNL